MVEFFGVYCPENRRVYMVPISETGGLYCKLRVEPAQNNQTKKVHWAKDFEVVPLPIPNSDLDASIFEI